MLRSSPTSLWRSFFGHVRRLRGNADRISLRRSMRLGGSSIVPATVSTSQPRMTFTVSRAPSPLSNFFTLMGSFFHLSSCPSGGRNTMSMQWKSTRRRRLCRLFPPWASRMKSSTYTSALPRGPLTRCRIRGGPPGVDGDLVEGVGVSATASHRCSGGDQFASIFAFVTSAAASVKAQNVGGDDTHPIGSPRKNSTKGS